MSDPMPVGTTTLPFSLTPLIGREREVAALRALVLDEGVRLLTLTGPGGVGKTRLALQVARQVSERAAFPDGVRFVSLGAVTDPALLLSTIAQALAVREAGDRSLLALVVEALRTERSLLILDNFEQIVAAATQVAAILAVCPTLTVLVTSRTVLRLSGEHDYPVQPLSLSRASRDRAPHPEGTRRRENEHATHDSRLTSHDSRLSTHDSDAVRLFLDRAWAVAPDLPLTAANTEAIAEVCRRLDGLPLAIELAAARCRFLSPPALLARLAGRLTLLTGGARDLPARQQTLRAAIAWSYDLLPPEQQALFRRLSVFAGGFSLGAAEWVMGHGSWVMETDDVPSPITHHPSAPSVLNGIAALVEQSLAQPQDAGDGDVRFGMLETIREYGLERLEAAGEGEAARAAHAAYVLAFAEQAEVAMRGSGQAAWVRRVDAERHNVTAALTWSLASGQAGITLRIAAALWRFWAWHGRLGEGRSWLERALAAGEDTAPAVRAKAFHFLGNTLLDLCDGPGSRAAWEASLAIRRTLDDRRGIADSLNCLGVVCYVQGDYGQAGAFHAEALTLRQTLGDRQAVALSLYNLGNLAREAGDRDRAATLHRQALAIRDEVGDADGLAYSHLRLAQIARDAGDLTEAERLIGRSLEYFRELGDQQGVAYGTVELGYLARARRDEPRAVQRFVEALTLRQELGEAEGIVVCLEALADVAASHGQAGRAARIYGATDAWRVTYGMPLLAADRHLQDRSIQLARKALGADAFASAWAAGRTLAIEEAIAEATVPIPLDPTAPQPVADPARAAGLTARELEVVRLIAAGHSNQEIADTLSIGYRTATTHVSNILTKLGIDSRTAVAAFAIRHGLA